MDVVRSSCPGCKKGLNVPADWVGKTVKCKFCGHAMQIRAKGPAVSVVAPAVPLAAAAPTPARAAPAPTWEPLPAEAAEDTVPNYRPAAPAPQGNYVSAFDTRDKYSGRGRYSGPKNRGWIKFVVLGFVFVAMASGAGVLAMKYPNLFRTQPTGEDPPPVSINPTNNPSTPGTPGIDNVAGAFPRRMLAVSIHSYLYANPIHNGDTGYGQEDSRRTGTDAAVRQLASRWKVPKEQLYHLTDARQSGELAAKKAGKMDDMSASVSAPKSAKAIPLKMVVEGAIASFLDSSRAQDRVVFLFCGHAMEKDGTAYLVPIEGDLDDLESLIPLKWVYDKLAACPAQEKIAIFDVCRFHPTRGVERPHPGPMSEKLETAFHSPPEGVSVVTSCSKGQQSLELDYYFDRNFRFDAGKSKDVNGIDVCGSFFLSLFHAASQAGMLAPESKLPGAADEIPLERLVGWMVPKVAQVVKNALPDQTQTVKATIKRSGTSVPPNATEPMPARFAWTTPPPSADPKAVQAIVSEIMVPPVKSFREDAESPALSDVLPFSEETLKPYLAGELKPSSKANDFQQAILTAVDEMKKLRSSGSATSLPEEFGGDTNDAAKEVLRRAQETPARVEAILQDSLDNLEAEEVASQKDKQPLRWQLHYDYVVAQLRLRICYVNQYNLALANVRGGKLPDLKEGQTGYRLAAETALDKNTQANYKDMFAEAKKSLTEIATKHPKTPWALLAKSDRTVAIGLRLTGDTVGSPK